MSVPLEELVRTSVRAEIEDLRRFVDRRIAELSTEIHATVQLVDFSEPPCRPSSPASMNRSPA